MIFTLGFRLGGLARNELLALRKPKNRGPPQAVPEAAILSRTLSPITSRSNWANDSRTFRVRRPIEVVVLNCWVTETNDTAF